MWTLAGKNARSVAMENQPAALRVAGIIVPTAPAISATPLAATSSSWAGR